MIAPCSSPSGAALGGMLQTHSIFSADVASAGGAGSCSAWPGAPNERDPLRDAGTNTGGAA